MDVLTPQQRRRCMQSNKSKGTKPELVLARLLWSCGIRYRKHPKNIIGKPDFCIKKYRLAIFVDGEFWHGRNWKSKKNTLKGNREFWIAKIERNIERDRKVTQTLQAAGWAVFRFWESDIYRHPGICLRQVLEYMCQYMHLDIPQYLPSDFYQEEHLAADPATEYGKET